jgi:hypothetical protein
MMMHPEIQKLILDDRLNTLRHDAQRPFRPTPGVEDHSRIELRLCVVDDLAALNDLATMNGVELPPGSFVVALVDGRLVAAQPIERGPLLADPFVRTAHLRRLLELRAEQLRPATRWAFHLPRAVRRATA